MANQETFSSVINYFTTNYEIRSSGRDNIKLGTRTHNPNQFAKRFASEQNEIAAHCGRTEFYGIMDDIEKDKGWKEDKIIEYMADRVFKFLKQRVDAAAKQSVTTADQTDMIGRAFDWSRHLPIIDIRSNQQLMFDTSLNRIDHGVTYSQWREWVNTRPSDEKKILLSTVAPASIVYDPKKIEEVQYKDIGSQEGVLHLNAHKTPEWRRPENRIYDPVLPPMFLQLMDHLFADDVSREYVYAWMNFMLTDRNHCYLFMHGDKGLGKSTLANICSELVGPSNYSVVDPPFWDGRFNSDLKYRRLVFFDETQVLPENLTRIRALTNRKIRIEEKGIDAVDLENHASFIIANNKDKYNLITYDDRRFSVPNMGQGNIKNVLGVEWLDRLYHALESDMDFIGNIGWWILEHGDNGEYTNTQPFITDTFYDLVDKALSNWQKNIIELIEQRVNDRYLLDDLREDLRGTGRVKLATFLENHRDREGEQYGYVGQDSNDGKRYLYVTEKYKPKGNFDSVTF